MSTVTVTEKRERDKERDEEGVPEDESSSDVSSAPSATKRAKATKNNVSSSSSLSSFSSATSLKDLASMPGLARFRSCLATYYSQMGKQKTTTQLDELIQKGINPTESFFDEWSEKLTSLCQHYCPGSVYKIPKILEKYNNHHK